MKKHSPVLSALLAFTLSLALLAGCADQSDSSTSLAESSEPESASQSVPEEPAAEEAAFDHSAGIDENGFWEGVTALDHVDLVDYSAISIPAETHEITDDAAQSAVDELLAEHTTNEQVTNRAVADGDTVNIDYVGSVDGVEFDGGSTGGAGTDVTIGVTSYIDDFLEQLVGHEPGETFNVEVTFPADYGVDDLNGKDAVFVTTVNHIVETVAPELTDGFVQENFSAEKGWSTAADMESGIRAELQENAVKSYIQEYLISEGGVKTLPDGILTYLENSMVSYYREYAGYFSMEFEEFLSSYMGVATTEELLEQAHDDNVGMGNYYLVLQAIAEDADISVDEADVAAYFENEVGEADYSQYEEQYGMPYLKQMALHQKVMAQLAKNAVLA